MGYITQTVDVYGTETDFIKAFISALNRASSGRISYDSTTSGANSIDTLFESNSANPDVYIDVDGLYKIKLTRVQAGATANTSNYYKIYTIINNIESDSYGWFIFTKSSPKFADRANRCWKFSLVINNNYVYLNFAGHHESFPMQKVLSVLSIKDMELVSANIDTGGNINTVHSAEATKSNFISVNDATENLSYSFADRIPYIQSNGKVEIIKSKTLVSSDMFSYNTENAYDCSKITIHSILTINQKHFYAISEHTLIPIEG